MNNHSLQYEHAYLRLKSNLACACILAPALALTSLSPIALATQQFSSFESSKLVIENLHRDVNLWVGETPQILIDDLPSKDVIISQVNEQLIIRGSGADQAKQSLDTKMVAINGSAYLSTSVNGSDSVNGESQTPLNISVPSHIDLTIKTHTGTIVTDGPFGSINYEGSGKLVVQSTRHLKVKLTGNGRVTVGEIQGDLNVSGSGNSKAVIYDGHIEDSELNLNGNTNVSFPGRADKLNLKAKGNAKLEIGRVDYLDEVSIEGNAKVKILQPAQMFTSSGSE